MDSQKWREETSMAQAYEENPWIIGTIIVIALVFGLLKGLWVGYRDLRKQARRLEAGEK